MRRLPELALPGLADDQRGSSTDTGGAGLAGYEYRTSTNGGTTWSGSTSGNSQFRSRDNADNTSAWAPAAVGASNTACIL